jgi:hypothetical protein
MEVDREPGKERTFRIKLPRMRPDNPTKVKHESVTNVMVVDDEETSCEALTAWFEEDGYQVESAFSDASVGTH